MSSRRYQKSQYDYNSSLHEHLGLKAAEEKFEHNLDEIRHLINENDLK